MDLAQPELTSSEERIAVCRSRVTGFFASQSASRECVQLTHQAISRSRKRLDTPVEDDHLLGQLPARSG
jgi:hypothetical protein